MISILKKSNYALGRGVKAFSTSRGDLSAPLLPYDGFNACDYTGDDPSHVDACRSLLYRELGVTAEQVIFPRQTHTDNVCVIDRLPAGNLDDVDGLVTSLPRVALAVNTADCVPVLMADPVGRVVAAVHSGWRGSRNRIVSKALDKMIALGADIGRIHVAVGPCICGDCYEVGEEVARQFFDYPRAVSCRDGRWHVDLIEVVVETLVIQGVRHQNIYCSGICSRCNSDEWFSARRLGVKSGRTLSVIMLQDE